VVGQTALGNPFRQLAIDPEREQASRWMNNLLPGVSHGLLCGRIEVDRLDLDERLGAAWIPANELALITRQKHRSAIGRPVAPDPTLAWRQWQGCFFLAGMKVPDANVPRVVVGVTAPCVAACKE